MKEKFFKRIVANVAILVILMTVGAATVTGGVMAVMSGTEVSPYYRGDADKANMSLMINVYWGTEYLDGMLRTLAERGVKCTFFVGGMWAAENSGLLCRMRDEGHELGNHGYYHKDATKVSLSRNREEIVVTERLIESLTGVRTRLFAPPSGDYNKSVVELATELGYRTVMWTQDTIDWRDKDADLICKRATAKAANGNLVLMHPTAATAAALPKIIDSLHALGYTLTTVTETLGETAPAV